MAHTLPRRPKGGGALYTLCDRAHRVSAFNQDGIGSGDFESPRPSVRQSDTAARGTRRFFRFLTLSNETVGELRLRSGERPEGSIMDWSKALTACFTLRDPG